jgi:uroporphyrinogen-III synthase
MIDAVYFAVSESSKNKILTLSKRFKIKVRVLRIVKQVELPFDIEKYLKKHFDWIVFTSSFGAKTFSKKVMKKGVFHYLIDTKFAAVGSETAKTLKENGLGVHFMPKHYTTAALAEEIAISKGEKVLTVRSKEGDDLLEKKLSERSCYVTRLNAYKEIVRRRTISLKKDDVVVFGSSYILQSFTKLLKNVKPEDLFAIAIGPKTLSKAKELGYRIKGNVKTYTYEGVFESLRDTLNGL